MYKQCKTEQSAARQRLLEKGFLELLEQMPYGEISVSDICAHLNIPRKTFYRYFPTKEDALDSLIDHTFLDMATCPPVAGREGEDQIQRELRRVFGFWEKQKGLLDVISRDHLMHLLFQRIVPLALAEMNIFRGPLSAMTPQKQEYVVGFFAGGIITMIMHWQNSGYADSVEQMAEMAAALLGSAALSDLIST